VPATGVSAKQRLNYCFHINSSVTCRNEQLLRAVFKNRSEHFMWVPTTTIVGYDHSQLARSHSGSNVRLFGCVNGCQDKGLHAVR
jgi:hypothetical protein